MIPYPHINPVAVRIGPLSVHWYGIMYLVGFAAAWWLARRRAMPSKPPSPALGRFERFILRGRPDSSWRPLDVDDFLFYAMLGVILGGRIGYVLFYGLPLWRADPLYPLKIWQGGMSFHGGLIGVLVAVAIFAWRRGRHVGDVFDFTAPLPGIGLFFGRLGNFINGELWGKPSTLPWAFLVPNPNGGPPVGRQPSQLYEALLEGVVLFTIVWMFTRRRRPRYAAAGLFLICYAVARIAVEFVREPDIGIGYLAFGWLTMGQLLSVPMLLAGLILMWAAYHYDIPSGNYGPATLAPGVAGEAGSASAATDGGGGHGGGGHSGGGHGGGRGARGKSPGRGAASHGGSVR